MQQHRAPVGFAEAGLERLVVQQAAGCPAGGPAAQQRQLKAQGITLTTEADETTVGPASFVAIDPDGNPVLVDQHR